MNRTLYRALIRTHLTYALDAAHEAELYAVTWLLRREGEGEELLTSEDCAGLSEVRNTLRELRTKLREE